MGDYSWYVIRDILKEFRVVSGWPSSSEWMRLTGPRGKSGIPKDNNIESETVHLMLAELGVSDAEFRQAYDAYMDGSPV